VNDTNDTQHATGYKPTSPDFLATLQELQGGTLPQILTRALADTAMGIAEHAQGQQKGKVTLEFTIKRGKGQFQLELAHRVAFSHPTLRGKKTEEASDTSTVFLNTLGHVSVVPDAQGNFNFN
jgi:hypothetical protein